MGPRLLPSHLEGLAVARRCVVVESVATIFVFRVEPVGVAVVAVWWLAFVFLFCVTGTCYKILAGGILLQVSWVVMLLGWLFIVECIALSLFCTEFHLFRFLVICDLAYSRWRVDQKKSAGLQKNPQGLHCPDEA